MASAPKTQKGSRWGFISQAVASVESRLDTILAEEDEPSKRTPPAAGKENVPSGRPSAEISRSGASTPTNDRLQARLAQAMAKKNASRSDSPVPLVVQSDEKATEQETSAKPSMEAEASGPAEPTTIPVEVETSETGAAAVIGVDTDDGKPSLAEPTSAQNDKDSLSLPRESVGSTRVSRDYTKDVSLAPSIRTSTESQSMLHPSQLSSQLEADEARQQLTDELTAHKGTIDALQKKLKALSVQARQEASDAASSAPTGSTERATADKDKRYFLLTEEFVDLQKREMSLREANKKLRIQALNSEKLQSETKQRAERADRDLRMMEDRARKAESVAKRAEQNLTVSTQTSSSFEAVKRERDALNSTLADIKAQLSRAHQRAEAAESKAASEQLQKERKRAAELQDDLSSAKVERELAEEKLRREVKDLTASLEREKENSRAMETEMLGEQAALESKLESFRARAEEASSSDQGDVQAKLLRQIETLQSQYAAASQNWQGIESSLLTRITNLEKERDDVAARESDVRRKHRETSSKLKRTERDLEDAQNRLPEIEKQLGEVEEEGRRQQRKIALLEDELTQTRKERDDQKAQHERDLKQRLEEERTKLAASMHTPRTESPLRKGTNYAPDNFDRAISRRSSVFPSLDTPSRQQSMASLKGLANGGHGVETPSIVTSQDPDEYFPSVPPTPASQSHATSPRALYDLVSTSTVGAGPSVQLVERMSANVRRLESEKAASKDEIARLTTQRDESRQGVVDLMREVDEKRDAAARLSALESEHQALTKRHQTTLELLGEKSEQVEELKADILDVKQMYRQLADTMGK